MASRGVHVMFQHPEVWDEFIAFVMHKHGKKHTVTAIELEQALINHMEEYAKSLKADEYRDNTHTHAHVDEQSQKKKRDLPMSPYHARLTTIQEKMKKVGAWDVESFQDGIAVRYIKEVCGGDPRTIQKYYSDLETKWSIEH